MSVNPQPIPNVDTFNNLYWKEDDSPLTSGEADLRYLRWPVAQGTENLQAINVNGAADFNSTVNVDGLLTAAAGLNMNLGEISSVSKLSYNSLMSPMTFEHGQFDGQFDFKIDGVKRCSVIDSGIELDGYEVNGCSRLGGKNDIDLIIRSYGTGNLRFLAGLGGNKLEFTDTNECLANSNGLKIQGIIPNDATIAIGNGSGTTQGLGAIAIGGGSGINQGADAIAIGKTCGTLQGSNSISLGLLCGGTSQGTNSVAIGIAAGTTQNNNCIAMGNSAGKNQALSCVAIGTNAGFTSQGANSVAIGTNSGQSSGLRTVAIGSVAAQTTQGIDSVAIGSNAGQTTQGTQSVAIGLNAGRLTQGQDSISIGNLAGDTSQRRECVSIGLNAGQNNQGTNWALNGDGSIAIGPGAGQTTQQFRSVAIGGSAGNTTQGSNSVAIGYASGSVNQAAGCVSIGSLAGQTQQKAGSICIGSNAGNAGAGASSIFIGNNCGTTSTLAGSIVLNGTGTVYNPATNVGFYVNPVRGVATATPVMVYNTGTGEVTYNTSSIKYKKNVIDLTTDTSVLHNLRAREYDSKDDDKHYIGYIAEEVDEVDTHFTWKNSDGTPEGLEWFNMLVYAIEEIKKLRIEVNQLKGL
jgi:hypothetical protein